MQIVELSDCSMVIMKDSGDSFYFSIGNIYRMAKRLKDGIGVSKLDEYDSVEASEYIYTAGRLILYFKENIKDKFKLHDKVSLSFLYKSLQ